MCVCVFFLLEIPLRTFGNTVVYTKTIAKIQIKVKVKYSPWTLLYQDVRARGIRGSIITNYVI